MKIALAQINPIVGDFNGNTEKIIGNIKKTNADIIVFPELSICGYSPQDLLLKNSFLEENKAALKKIVAITKDKCAIVGFAEKAGNDTYNCAAVIRNSQIIEIHRKMQLPNYKIFDEKRWFTSSIIAGTFEYGDRLIGVNICEDIWLPDVANMQKDKGAKLLINISASPYGKGKIESIENVLKQRWNENKIPIIYVNQAGSQDGIVFYGHSMYFNDGIVIAKCSDFEEEILVVDVE